jgi:hypothetical protein
MPDDIKMADAILDLVTKHRGSVSFAELSREIPGFAGDVSLIINTDHCSNICLWPGVSVAAADALDALRTSGAIHARPASLLVYLCDGAVPQMPIAKRSRHYKKLHWAPTVFYPGPAQPPQQPTTRRDPRKADVTAN